jgi:hypothetical protein
MAIFGKSKKTTSAPPPPPQQQQQQQQQQQYYQQQQQPSLLYSSQTNLSPYANVPPPSSQYLDRPNSTHGYPPHPPSQGWSPAAHYQPVHVTQNYYLSPPLPLRPKKSYAALGKLKPGSTSKLELPSYVPGAKIFNDGIAGFQQQGIQYFNPGSPVLYDQICAKLDSIVTQIDGERFSGDEGELAVTQPLWQQQQQESGYTNQGMVQGKSKGMVNNGVSNALTGTNYFAKVNLYANSRLPPNLPPMKL